MAQLEQIKNQLSLKVLKKCLDNDITEVECEPYIKELISNLPKHYRPTTCGVMMETKRKLWNLTPMKFKSDK